MGAELLRACCGPKQVARSAGRYRNDFGNLLIPLYQPLYQLLTFRDNGEQLLSIHQKAENLRRAAASRRKVKKCQRKGPAVNV